MQKKKKKKKLIRSKKNMHVSRLTNTVITKSSTPDFYSKSPYRLA